MIFPVEGAIKYALSNDNEVEEKMYRCIDAHTFVSVLSGKIQHLQLNQQ